MITTLCGPNHYAVRQSLNQLVADFVAAHGDQAVMQLDGQTCTLQDLTDAVQSSNLFTPQTMVVLRSPSAQKQLLADLEQLLPDVPESTTLVIADGPLDKRTRTYKWLQKNSQFTEFAELDERSAGKWIGEYVRDRGASITPDAQRELLARTGPDQWRLATELDKLTSYTTTIDLAAIELLVAPSLEVSAFDMLDAVFARQQPKVQKLMANLQASADPYEFFGLLVWQVHALALVSAAGRAQVPDIKPFVAQKMRGLLAKRHDVTDIVDTVAHLDVRLKSSGTEPWVLIEQALFAVATP